MNIPYMNIRSIEFSIGYYKSEQIFGSNIAKPDALHMRWTITASIPTISFTLVCFNMNGYILVIYMISVYQGNLGIEKNRCVSVCILYIFREEKKLEYVQLKLPALIKDQT